MLKILQAKFQQYMNQELPYVQARFRKGRRTRDQISNIHWITEKAREFQKNIYFCFIDHTKAFDCVGHNKLWTILKEIGVLDYLTKSRTRLSDWTELNWILIKQGYVDTETSTHREKTMWKIQGEDSQLLANKRSLEKNNIVSILILEF